MYSPNAQLFISHWFACGQLSFVVWGNSIINIKLCGNLSDQLAWQCGGIRGMLGNRGSGFDTGEVFTQRPFSLIQQRKICCQLKKFAKCCENGIDRLRKEQLRRRLFQHIFFFSPELCLTPLSAGSTRLEHKCSALSGLQMCELANKDTSFIILPEAERCCFFCNLRLYKFFRSS